MKYKSIELINYAGIYNGMGLNQIKIDFTKCVSNKIIIRGSNGSGKSTLCGAIHPIPDSNDKFIPNAEARKNIVLDDHGVEYVIRYVHPVTNSGRGTTKGYIAKSVDGNLIELNPNGNISSCRDILYEEFNLDSNYISLSQLSSEDRGLVDHKPAERKKLLNSIINVLETYNSIYKNLSKKASHYRSLITNITSKIDYLGDGVKLQAQVNSLDKRIAGLESDKASTIEAIAAVKIKIADYTEVLKSNKYDEVLTELATVNRVVKYNSQVVEKALQNYGISSVDKLRDFLDYIKQQIFSIEADLDSKRRSIPGLLSQREVEYSELQNKQTRLNSLQSDHNYLDVKRVMDETRTIIASHEEVFSKMGLMNIKFITKEDFDTAMESLKYLLDATHALTSAFSIDYIRKDVNDRALIVSNISSIQDIERRIETLKEDRLQIEKIIAQMESKREVASELVNRPSDCKIDSCPYISAAVEASKGYSDASLAEYNNKLTSVNDQIVQLQKLLEDLKISAQVRTQVAAIERELSSKMKFIKKLPISIDFEQTFMQRVIDLDPFNDIIALYRFVDCGNMIEEYKNAVEQYRIYKSEYKIYESKNELIESILRDIESLQKKTDSIAESITAINKDIADLEAKLIELEDLKSKIKDILAKYDEVLVPNMNRQRELTTIKESLDMNTVQIQELRNNLNHLNNNLGSIDSDIRNLTEQREALKHSLILLADYKAELENYNIKYVKLDKIKYYASPTSGIQSVYIQMYMNSILSTANDLLSLLFNGEFILQPFIVNESEFRIPCIGSGLMHDDISSMSTAQKSMISLIISFSLLHQSATKYNIISLDELDGGLDTSNRLYFINLLDQLMVMLGCEQAFIISHNNELDTSMADVIALKNDSNELINGNIIWQY